MISFGALKSSLMRAVIATIITALLLSSNALPPAQAAAGDLDTTFGGDGKVTTTFANFNSRAQAVAIQPDGKIIAAGNTSPDDFLLTDFAIARYNPGGALDLSFGTGGKVLTDFFGGFDQATALAIQPDGKIIVAGEAAPSDKGFDADFALARYDSNGNLDTSFGAGGKVLTDFFGDPAFAFSDHINAIIIRPDGKIIAVGSTFGAGGIGFNFALARYNSDGSLDTTFGTGGKVATSFGFDDFASDAALQQDGKIVAVGSVARTPREQDFVTARYNPDGSLDASFGTGGKVITNFDTFDSARSVAVQADGKLMVAGSAKNFAGIVPPGGVALLAFARYNSNGSLDATFGSGGTETVGFSNNLVFLTRMVLRPDGKMVVTVSLDVGFTVAQINSDGSLDLSFGTGGKADAVFFGVGDLAADLALQPDGKIVVAGEVLTSQTLFDFGLARFDGGGQEVSFDLCILDDTNGNLLQFNSNTGDYQFSNCRKQITLTGRGTVEIRFCKIEFQAIARDRNIVALANTCTHAGTASVKLFSPDKTFTISDKDITNNNCSCR